MSGTALQKQIFGGNYVYSACYGFTGYHLWMSHFGDSFAEAVAPEFLGCDDIGIAVRRAQSLMNRFLM